MNTSEKKEVLKGIDVEKVATQAAILGAEDQDRKALGHKKEAVRQFIVRAVPDILQLSRGCDVILYGVRQRFVKYDRNSFEFVTDKGEATLTSKELRERVEVIGRPIQLADVLVAIGGLCEMEVTTQFLMENKKGEIVEWDLSQDFDHQSEEVYDFLWSLLCE